MSLHPPPLPYLDNTDIADPLNRIALGATDARGANENGLQQTAYDDYVEALQEDLWKLGFRSGVNWGVFDATTEDVVLRFQKTARRDVREGAPRPAPITFEGGVTGVVDVATRREIKKWLAEGWYWAEPQIAENVARKIFAFTARKHTGRDVEGRIEDEANVRTGVETRRWVPGALHLASRKGPEGMRAGLLGYSQRSGWLGKLLNKVHRLDGDLLGSMLGDFRDFYNALRSPIEAVRMGARLPDDEHWERFIAHPVVTEAQLYLAMDELLWPVLAVAKTKGIRTIKGLALLADVAYTVDVDTAVFAADACEYRDQRTTVAEHMVPALYVLRRLLEMGNAKLLDRYQELLADPGLDEVEEYGWSIRIKLIEGNPSA